MRSARQLISLCALGAFGAVNAQEVVRIGIAGPLSGEIAHLGKAMENGAAMAIDDLNARGTAIGGRKVVFKLVSEDDAADPKQGPSVAQKLADMHVSGVIGHATSGTTLPASRVYHQAGIPEITPSATTAAYTHQGYNNVFRVVANDNMLGATLGRYAVDKLHARRIAVIDDRSAYGQGVADEFVKSVRSRAADVTIVAREFTTAKATDFTSLLTGIKAKQPDLIFFGGMDASGSGLVRQMKALGMQVPFMGGDGICTEAFPQLAGGAVRDGAVYCAEAGGVEGAHEKALNDFIARFHAKYHSDIQTYAPYNYDAVMVMAAAMQKAGSADPAAYLPVLRQISYQGITGMIKFDKFGDIENGAMTLSTFKGGRKVKLDVLR